jgi:hypothetical protein
MPTDPRLPAAQRKQLLQLQGQVFRAGLVLAQHDVRAALQPRALLRNAMGDMADTGIDAARHLLSVQSLLDGRLAMLLPLAGRGMGLLARHRLLRPAALALLTGGLGYAGWRIWQRRRQAKAAQQQSAPQEADAAGQQAPGS